MSAFDKYITTNKSQFLSKLDIIAEKLQTKPIWLKAIMFLESGLNPKAINYQDGVAYAGGLIQWIRSTASSKPFYTTIDKIVSMSNVEQLDLVYLYYKPFTGRLNSFFDFYMATFLPVGVGKPDNWVLQTNTLSAERIAKLNSGYDLNKNNQITIAEIKQAISKRLTKEMLDEINLLEDSSKKKVTLE